MKNCNVLIYTALTIFIFLGCGGGHKNQVKQTSLEQSRNQDISIIINDKKIKDEIFEFHKKNKEDLGGPRGSIVYKGAEFITALQKKLNDYFDAVEIKPGYSKPKDGELILTPQIVAGSIITTNFNALSAEVKASTSIKITVPDDFWIYSIERTGSYSASLGTHILSRATVVGVVVLENTYEKIASDNAINHVIQSTIEDLLSSRTFRNYATIYRVSKTLPANLIAKVYYSDNNSIIPNNIINAGENSVIAVDLINDGKGTAYDVQIKTQSYFKDIEFPESVLISDIQPGESKEIIINLKAGLDLESGKAPFTIYASEKRGYDSKKVKVQIPTARLEKPDLEFVDYRMDDGNTGLAHGNGNGIAESGETIELTAFIKNRGQGDAISVNMSAGEINPGIKWIKDKVAVGIIPPGRTAKAKVAFAIPRNFNAKEIQSSLQVGDIRGVSSAEKMVMLAYSRQSPELQYSYRILSRRQEVKSVINGEEYEIELIVKNDGQLSARDVVAAISSNKNIEFGQQRISIGELQAGSSYPVQMINIHIPRTYMEANLPLNVTLKQSDFASFEDIITIPVNLKSPQLLYDAVLLSKNRSNVIEKGESAILEVNVLNEGSIPAEAVVINVVSMDEDMSIIGKNEYALGRIPAKSRSETTRFQITTKRRITTGDKHLKINIDQKDFSPVLSKYIINITEEDLRIIDLASEDSKKSSAVSVPENARAPSIKILSPQSGETVDDENAYLAVDITDYRSVENVRVEVNGIALPIQYEDTSTGDPKKRKIRSSVELQEGSNRIFIYAYNSDNLSERKEIEIMRKPEVDVDTPLITSIRNPDAVAVVIGISRYGNPDIPAVDYARRDAETIKKYLIHTLGFKEHNVIEVYDQKAMLANLKAIFKSKLSNMIEEPGKSDLFIFYSGHGVPSESKEPYIVPYNFDPYAIDDTGYKLNDFYTHVSELKARDVTIVIDACFSGSSERGLVIKGISPAFLDVENPVIKMKNAVVITSSAKRQLSSWYHKKHHGLFTYYFLMGLKGVADADGNGRITVEEMMRHLDTNVPKQARYLYNREQTPQVLGDKEKVLLNYQ